MTAPILARPSHASGQSIRFGNMMPTRSPWSIPSPASAVATRSTRVASSAKVGDSPVSSNTSAVRSGQRTAARRIAVTRSSTASAGMSYAASRDVTPNPVFGSPLPDFAAARTTPHRARQLPALASCPVARAGIGLSSVNPGSARTGSDYGGPEGPDSRFRDFDCPRSDSRSIRA